MFWWNKVLWCCTAARGRNGDQPWGPDRGRWHCKEMWGVMWIAYPKLYIYYGFSRNSPKFSCKCLHQPALSQKLVTDLWWYWWLGENQCNGPRNKPRKSVGETLAACSCKTSQRERRWEKRDLRARRMFPCFFIPPVFRQTELHVQTDRGASPVLVSIKFFSCEYKVEGEGVVTAVFTAVLGIFSAHCLCLWNNITIFKGMKAKFALIKRISTCYKQMYFVKTTKLTLKYYCISWLKVHLHHS